jgi:hypothetical protein
MTLSITVWASKSLKSMEKVKSQSIDFSQDTVAEMLYQCSSGLTTIQNVTEIHISSLLLHQK